MDLGVSEGNDTAYYLAKGFKVLAVEADPETCKKLKTRFSFEIENRSLTLLNFAASDTFGNEIEFFVHQEHQGVSATFKHQHLDAGYVQRSVTTINWTTLKAQFGMPRYLKIDIEGAEDLFLRGMIGSDVPEFISVECHALAPVALLQKLGYERFKLVDQNPPGGFKQPSKQVEGHTISWDGFHHASGPFGLDVFDDREWLCFDQFSVAWEVSRAETYRTWFDCHAWKPN